MKTSIIAILLGGMLACNEASTESSSVPMQDITQEKGKSLPLEQVSGAPDLAQWAIADTASAASALQAGQPGTGDWNKKIIREARITLELENFESFDAGMHQRLSSFDAYITEEQQSTTDVIVENNLTIKVPAARFEEFISKLHGVGISMLEKNIVGDDVTGDVVDIQARLEAKKQVRARYLELLQQARNIKDILEVQQEINSVQEELEAARARLSYLTHRAAYSTVQLRYFQYIQGAGGSKPLFLQQLQQAFHQGGQVLVNMLLFLVSVWPVWLGATVLFFYYKNIRLKKV